MEDDVGRPPTCSHRPVQDKGTIGDRSPSEDPYFRVIVSTSFCESQSETRSWEEKSPTPTSVPDLRR